MFKLGAHHAWCSPRPKQTRARRNLGIKEPVMPAGSPAPDEFDASGTAYCGRFLGAWMPADECGWAADNLALSAPPHACRLAFAPASIDTEVRRSRQHYHSAMRVQMRCCSSEGCVMCNDDGMQLVAAAVCPFLVHVQFHSRSLSMSPGCSAVQQQLQQCMLRLMRLVECLPWAVQPDS